MPPAPAGHTFYEQPRRSGFSGLGFLYRTEAPMTGVSISRERAPGRGVTGPFVERWCSRATSPYAVAGTLSPYKTPSGREFCAASADGDLLPERVCGPVPAQSGR